MRDESTTVAPERTCTICGRTYPATRAYFNRRKDGRDGLHTWCRICAAERRCQRACGESGTRSIVVGVAREVADGPLSADDLLLTRRFRNKAAKSRLRYGGTLTASDIRLKYRVQEGCCFWCGKFLGIDFEVDHATPISRGGPNIAANIVIACRRCNSRKCAKMPHEFRAEMVCASCPSLRLC